MTTIETLRIADCSVGTTLPELPLLLDRTLIVAAAVASQDFEDVHHDPSKAVAGGMQDIFMSINTTNGLIDRYVTDVFGAQVRIAKVSLRLGVPNFPGDTMTFTGEVTGAESGTIDLRVAGRNERGPHVTATVRVVQLDPADPADPATPASKGAQR